MNTKFVITIGREFGSGGRQIGKQIARLLNIAYYDKELLEEASRLSGVSKDFLEQADEKAPSLFEYALLGAFGNENVLSNSNFYVLLSNVISAVADQESCVIVGRSADYILRNHPNCLNLFIHAPEQTRVRHVCERMGVTEAQGTDLVEKQDKCRAKFYNFYTDKTWGSAASYHLSIDSSVLGMEDTARYLKEFIDSRFRL